MTIDTSSGCFIYNSADPGGPAPRAACQVVVDPSSELRERVRIYDDLPARVGVRGCMAAHAFVQLFYCVCALGSIPGADGETRGSMSCDHEVQAAYDH